LNSPDAIDAVANIAVAVSSSAENIGARRLQTVMERVLDHVSFAAPRPFGRDRKDRGRLCAQAVGDLANNADLSRFIL
jgi:ATP-dependent HslUV protease ATP-binding subunit HslU